jgi:hypothetical protein
MSHTDRIPYPGKQPNRFVTVSLDDAKKMKALADKSGSPYDYELAADLYEKVQHFYEARICREIAKDLNATTR